MRLNEWVIFILFALLGNAVIGVVMAALTDFTARQGLAASAGGFSGSLLFILLVWWYERRD